MPSKKIGVFPLPFPLPVRVLWGGSVAFDVLGAMGKLPIGEIVHGKHLAGDVIGILLYSLASTDTAEQGVWILPSALDLSEKVRLGAAGYVRLTSVVDEVGSQFAGA